ncbi:MAG: chromosome partitioning protein ParA [Gammaproteobacteria bacterium]|nr:chromosome partitioning protein ParA [Gammaproteobacteria bacterium]
MNAPKPSRQLMTEAVLLFNDSGIATEMLYPEFEAVLDNIVSMPERADQQVRAAYVTINPRLQVRAVVLFYLDFDEQGSADPGWNIPLRQLVEKADYGPDLGGGPVRLVCRSQSPVPWLQMHLWDPDMSPGHNHLSMIRECVRRNQLRLLTEEELPPASSVLELDRLQVAAEEAWQLPSEVERKKKLEQENLEREQEQRKKAAQLIKQQRLRIRTLEAEHDQAIARLHQQADAQLAAMRQNMQELEQALQQQGEQNQQLLKQVEQLASIGNEARSRLQNVAAQEQNQIAALRNEFDQELQSHKALLASTLQEQQQQLQQRYAAQLAEQQALLQKSRQDAQAMRQEYKQMLAESRSVLHRLAEADVSLVTMQPGAGHITIPVDEVDEFLKSPHAYAAKYCMVSEDAYKVWLRHYEAPVCDALIPVTGEPCGLPLERKTHPGRFTPGISNRCSRHKELW